MSKTIERSIAKRHYAKFAKQWREDLRTNGIYGSARSPKRPTFSQWYALHEKNINNTKDSTVSDVREFVTAATGRDPWLDGEAAVLESDRGVTHIPMFGSEEEEQ